jgi:hypothetical protein
MPDGAAKCPQCGLGLATPVNGKSAVSTAGTTARIATAIPVAPPPAPKSAVRVRGAASLATPVRKPAAPDDDAPQGARWVGPAVLVVGLPLLAAGAFLLVKSLTAVDDPPTPTGGTQVAVAPKQGGPEQPPKETPPDKGAEQAPPKEEDGPQEHKLVPVEDPKDRPPPKKIDDEHSGELPPLIRPVAPPQPELASASLFPDIPVLAPTKYRLHELTISRQPRPLRLAVTPPRYDNMGALLTKLGAGYKHTQVQDTDLVDLKKLSEFDVLFLTCSASNTGNLKQNTALRQFVERGGTLYASDLRFDAVAGAFPDYVDNRQRFQGRPGKVTADVVNAGLRDLIGKQVPITFNAGGWKAAAFDRKKVTTFLEGNFQASGGLGQMTRGQFMVKFTCKKGAVIFTSFHNSAQNSAFETALLKYIVFTAVTTQVEAEMREALRKHGFTPQDTKRHSISRGETSPVHTYKLEKSGALQFALGLEGQGASQVRLALVTPRGEKIEHDGNSSFIFEVPDAPAGEWRYSVRATEVPYANYPMTVTVGKKN